ncbi:hypothetical protein D2T31_19740 [Sinirhodobacter populi]|uniref:Uncharacterized protein n=1 Tax=Paenirhodobacter populi TaxID=2306993 RepID=A0A443K1A1_9RHOB|nr:hypothetical protein [Sinirhodobacter populi]RWR26529.1 hypothetical protein D2T31_19740 [Sinirhodobacter populi]
MMASSRFTGLFLAGLISVQGISSSQAQDAHFIVQPQVVNPDLPAFTATVGGLGNGAEFMRSGGGFEPSVFRNRLAASSDAPNTIFADPRQISNYDSWPEGAFDGADVEVLRIVDGVFQTVRRDRVAQGGYHASGWLPILPAGQVLSAEATRWNVTWDGFNRRGVPWYYTVRAVDASGNLSPPAMSVSVTPPPKPGKVTEKLPLQKLSVTGKENGSLPMPTNLSARLTVSGTALLSWDPVPGAAGYVVYRSDLPPERQRGYSIELEGEGAPIRAGDMILLRKKFYAPTRAEVATNRIWNASATASTFGVPLLPGMSGDEKMPPVQLVPHEADTPVQDPGETYLHIDLRGGKDIFLGRYNVAGPANGYYPVLNPDKTYRFEIWLRGQGQIKARFGIGGVYKSVPGLPAEFSVDSQWRKYVVDFRVPPISPDNKSVGQMGIRLSGDGQVDVDNFRIYQTDSDFMDLRPEDRSALEESGMSALRMHMFIKTKQGSYDLSQLTAPAGVSPQTGGHSLPQMLKITQSLGMDPWMQVEPHFSAEEWLGLVEYLAAPFDPAKDDPKALPWAAKRAAQGHPAPWTDDFKQIYFEVGNETWNRLFAPWTFAPMSDQGRLNWTKYTAGEVYGLYQEHVLSIMRQSPWWDRLAAKIEPVLGGWGINDYGVDALKRSPSSRVLTNAAYIGGWDSGEGAVRQTPEGYASVMAYAPQVMEASAKRYHDAMAKIAGGREVILGTYESGPGYELSGLNGSKVSPERSAEQERVMKSAAAGAATLDSFLTRAMAGDRTQNFFTFGRGNLWRSHARLEEGGLPYPSWDWLALFNRLGAGGDLLQVDAVTVPGRDLPAYKRRQEIKDAPMAAIYAARKGDQLTVVVISRAVPDVPPGSDGRMSVQVDLPITGAKRLTRYHESGDYRAENFTGPQTRIQSDELNLPAEPGRLKIGDLQPASAEVYVFEGVEFAE